VDELEEQLQPTPGTKSTRMKKAAAVSSDQLADDGLAITTAPRKRAAPRKKTAINGTTSENNSVLPSFDPATPTAEATIIPEGPQIARPRPKPRRKATAQSAQADPTTDA
jgi:hypothetical protein